jgi:hypothetical protein
VEKYKDIQADHFLLHEKFRVMESSDPIPLQAVRDACTADSNVRSALHRRLNYFEALAVGCRNHVYDESIVKAALETLFTNTLSQFQPYVDHRRVNGSAGFGLEFETLSIKWRAGRVPTGGLMPAGFRVS